MNLNSKALSTAIPRSRGSITRWIALLALTLAAIAFPFWIGRPYYVFTLADIFVLAIWGMSLALLIGWTGLFSFGHAASYGLAAYACGLLLKGVSNNVLLALLGSVVFAGLMAFLVGMLVTRTGGIAFALLTMAFSQLFYAIVWQWRTVTGGEDGLSAIPVPVLWIPGVGSFKISDATSSYLLALVVLVTCFLLLRRLTNSPFGSVLLAIRENENRAATLGYNVWLYKLLAYTIAGAFAGLAGAVFAMIKGHVSPDTLYWTSNGTVLIVTLFGGVHALPGPLIGAAVYMLLRDYISTITMNWLLYVGLIFLVIVLLMPRGIAGFSERGYQWVKDKLS